MEGTSSPNLDPVTPLDEPLPQEPELLSSMKFLLKTLLWGLAFYYLATEMAGSKLWFTIIAVLIVSTPIALAGIYSSTIKQIRRLEIFAHRGMLFGLLSGRPIKIIVWICWALFCGFFMLLQFQLYNLLERVIFFLVVPIFWLTYHLCRRLMLAELKPYLLTNQSLALSRKLTPLIMIVLYLALLIILGENVSYDSIGQAVQATRGELLNADSSALVTEATNYLSLYEGLKAYTIGRVGTLDSMGALLLICIGSYVVFFNACAMLSCFLIPGNEYRRILTPLSSSDFPESPKASTISMTVAVATFLTLFICIPMVVYLEASLQQNPEVDYISAEVQTQTITPFEKTITYLEKIDDIFFSEGTLEQLDQARIQARIQALENVDASLDLIEEKAIEAFIQMENNVDAYLDWYYSLTAEYGRIGTLLVGNLEEYMTDNLKKILMQEAADFGEVENAFSSALADHEEAQRIYEQSVQDIMAANRVEPGPDDLVEISRLATLSDILSPPVHQDMLNFDQRMRLSGGGAAAGAVGAVVISKVIAKVVGKSTLKLAATATAKVFASKAVSSSAAAGAGAVAGATIGSIVPGLGTAIGAVIGGVIGGLAAGVTIDKGLIEIEEWINRDKFKAEIIESIQEARVEFMESFR